MINILNKSTVRNLFYWSILIVGSNTFAIYNIYCLRFQEIAVCFVVMLVLALINDIAWHIVNMFLFELLLVPFIVFLIYVCGGIWIIVLIQLILIGVVFLMFLLSACFKLPLHFWATIFSCFIIFKAF